MTRRSAILSLAPASLLREATRPWAPERGARLLVAVSGGGDSVALLHVLTALAPGRGWDLVVATLDHGLRGDAGAADRRFVEDLARSLGWPVESAREDVGAGRSPEDAAREVRHAFLRAAAAAAGAGAVALGHTLDDQAETVLHRLGRGAGLLGLGAMRRWSPPLWRPLLGIRRGALRELLRAAGQAWREDETNASTSAARGRIRGGLIPAWEQALGPGATAALARAATLAADDEDFIAVAAREAESSIVLREAPDCVELDRRRLAELPPALARRILRACCARLAQSRSVVGAAHILALEALARGDTDGAHADLPEGLTAHRKGRVLTLEFKRCDRR